jgi:hypothetical protein
MESEAVGGSDAGASLASAAIVSLPYNDGPPSYRRHTTSQRESCGNQQQKTCNERRRILREINGLAARETAIIFRWKRLLIAALLIGAVFVSTGAFVLLSREEAANCRQAVSRHFRDSGSR